MICAPITASSNDKAKADLKEAALVADLAELRLDFLTEPPRLAYLLEGRPCPVIVTNRPARQGGFFTGAEPERMAPLKEAIQLGAEYVDIEYDAIGRLGDKLATQIIVSYHDFERTPADLRHIARTLLGAGGDIIKIATYATDITDIFRLCQFSHDIGVPAIVVGMGIKGVATRILTRKFAGYLTYGALRRDEGSAPGQLTALELKSIYHFDRIGRHTKVYGVIGNPIIHSVSPHIHNAAFRHLGMNAVYLPFEVDELGPFLAGCRMLDPEGFSVTIPHKEAALRLVDEADKITHKIGAANTIAVRDDKLIGTNTDWQSAIAAIKSAFYEGETLSGKRVLLLGAGGASRAIAFGLKKEGAQVTIANRTFARARALAVEVPCEAVEWEKRCEVEADVIANSTSIGMYPAMDATPMPTEALKPNMVVFDAVYNPRETRLLRGARDAGCRTAEGLEMFVEQAVAQFEFWTGKNAPIDVMREAAIAALGGE
jgi:3-dehydroquinate dehydratase / shikimate dehydrogenase